MERIKKYIRTPSIYTVKNGSTNSFLDINYLLWNHLFSKKYVKDIFSNCKKQNLLTEAKEVIFKYYLENYKEISQIIKDTYSYPFEEQRMIYCFKVLSFIIDRLNEQDKIFSYSLIYGVSQRYVVTDDQLEKYLTDENTMVYKFLNQLLLGHQFFTDNTNYVIKFEWENELIHVLMIAKLLKSMYTDISVAVDFSLADEQVDFSTWEMIPIFNKYIDSIYNLEIASTSNNINFIESKLFGVTTVYGRLFNKKCFWHKCAYCAINSQFKSNDTIETLNSEAIDSVNNIVDYLKNNSCIKMFTLTDEAIESDILFYIAESLIKENIRILWVCRTRFSSKLTKEKCELLAKSGLRSIGFGLESVNERIIRLMNKRDYIITKQAISKILFDLDDVGVNSYAYLILGFPSETKVEAQETIDFVVEHLYKLRFFLFAANPFYLMKGSEIYKYPEKFNISIIESANSIFLSNIRYIDHSSGEKYTREETIKITRELTARIILRDNYRQQYLFGYGFWDFIQRSLSIRNHKANNRDNPYWLRHNNDNKQLTKQLMIRKYKLIPLINRNNAKHEFFNLQSHQYIFVDDDIYDIFLLFLKNYKKTISLKENIDKVMQFIQGNKIIKQAKFNTLILKLINQKVLYQNRKFCIEEILKK
ncbi:MAG: hypothetical protein A2Y40_09995 [Candidatus Margulisbacteria bacterium GWF2_35_9]|nr:MAG: hypothetical protein A2Y40_09995 [Candidatus Margulisbacteria bacterium GWF2_35_9]